MFFSYLVKKIANTLRNSNRRPHSKISPAFLPFVSFPSPCLFFPSLYPTLLQPLPSHLLTVAVLTGSHRELVASGTQGSPTSVVPPVSRAAARSPVPTLCLSQGSGILHTTPELLTLRNAALSGRTSSTLSCMHGVPFLD